MLARITSIGGDLYHVYVLEEGHPDQGLPGRPPHVGNRPPGTGFPPHVSTGPVWPGRPVDPGYGVGEGHPDQGLPGGGHFPGNLPSEPPPVVAPGQTLIMVRDQFGTWYFATIPNSSAPPRPGPPLYPDQGLPGQPGHPDQGLPGRPPHVGGGPVPSPQPPRPGQGLPPRPGMPPRPDQGLPPQPGHPDQGLPPEAQPKPV
jgi:hypothetical protein